MAGIASLTQSLREDSDDDELYSFEQQNGQEGSNESDLIDIHSPSNSKDFRSRRQSEKILPPKSQNQSAAKIDNVNLLSFITYAWIFPYLWSAFRGSIPRDQQWSCSIYDSANVNMARLDHLWREEVAKAGPKGPSLAKVVYRFISARLWLACAIFLFCLGFGFIGPTCLIRVLIEFVEQKGNQNFSYGLALVFSLLFVEFFRVLSYGACWAVSYRTGIRVRGGILALLYKKLMHLKGLGDKTIGEVINIFANDGQRLFDAVSFAPLVLMGGFVLIGGLIYLLVLIGPWSLMGLVVFALFDGLQAYLGRSMVKFRKLAIEQTEKRVGIITEILNSIKIIKMYAWEYPFMDKVEDARKLEKENLPYSLKIIAHSK